MLEKFNLEEMLLEIQENESVDFEKETGRVSQTDIQKLVSEHLDSMPMEESS